MAAVLVWRRDPVNGRVYQEALPLGSTVRDLLPASGPGTSCCGFYVTCNGRRLSGDKALQDEFTYSVEPRLLGGKGGFGSMLRALGAQIEKTTNREACRDLSGRRLRDVNHEKAMAEWIKKQADREAEKEQRRLERLKRKLEEPKHYFTDPEYHRQRSDMSERLEDSVIKGLQATSSTVVSPESSEAKCCKRRKESQSDKGKSKKTFTWTGMEGLEMSSSSESDSESPSTSSSCHSAEQSLHSSESDSDEQAQCSTSITEELRNSIRLDEEVTSGEQSVVTSDQAGHVKEDTDERQQNSGQTEHVAETANERQQISAQAERVAETADERQQISSQREHVAETADERQQISSQREHVAETTDERQQISSQREHVAETADERQQISAQAERVAETEDERQQISSQREHVAETADERQQISAQAEHSEDISEPEKPNLTLDPPKEPSSMDTAAFNLMSFSSSLELEALGLDKLKTELMALGLKCGGTLQERGARLFSVRGLSRDRIDPALLAKPAKGKKK